MLTLWPFTLDIESLVIPMVACTWLIEDSKLAAVVTAAVPSPATAALTGSRALPADSTLPPASLIFVPAAAIDSMATEDFLACSSKRLSSSSVAMSSLCRASYWSLEISPLERASLACAAAVFKVSSFSLVSPIASERSRCF